MRVERRRSPFMLASIIPMFQFQQLLVQRIDSAPEQLLVFRAIFADVQSVFEASLAATYLIDLNMAIIMEANCYENLPLGKHGMSEANLEALTQRITALEHRRFSHLRTTDDPSGRPQRAPSAPLFRPSVRRYLPSHYQHEVKGRRCRMRSRTKPFKQWAAIAAAAA